MSSDIVRVFQRPPTRIWENELEEYGGSLAWAQAVTPDTNSAHSSQLSTPDQTLIRLWDPVAFLPPEIALVCLREALPSDANYPAALIELTCVSLAWQRLLFSGSVLWTQIHVRYSAHDLFAIISLFLHLSATAPLDLIICNALGPEWEDIKSLLLPHTDRIHTLALGKNPPIYSESPHTGAAYLSLVSDVFNSLKCPPHLVSLDFGRSLRVNPSQLKPLDLMPGTRIRSTISVLLQDSGGLCHSIGLLSGGTTPQITSFGASVYSPTRYKYDADGPMLSDFLPIDSHGSFNGANDSISSLNASIMSLVDILTSLDCPGPTHQLSTTPLYMNFVNSSDKRCRLCNRQRGSLSAALGCVRFHFGLRPFRCPGCRTCNGRKGYARFCSFHLLLNHIGPKTCVACGTQQTMSWAQDTAGDPLCRECDLTLGYLDHGTISFMESGGEALHPADMALFKSRRPAKERIHWDLDENEDENVSNLLAWVEAMSGHLASLAIHKYITTKSRGALVSNAYYRPVTTPDEPAFDWMTFEQGRRTLDTRFQEEIAKYDPSTTFIVYVFLVSLSGDSVTMWSRTLLVPEELRSIYDAELEQANAYVSRKPHVVAVERIVTNRFSSDHGSHLILGLSIGQSASLVEARDGDPL